MNINDIKSKIISANSAYRSGTPIMSDQAFDDLCDEYQKLVSEDAWNAFRDSLHEVKGKVKHPFVMGSLDKLKFEEPAEVKKFITTYFRNALNVSAKVDGISCRLHYEGGKLVSASTRGDGYYGEDLTDKIKHVKFIPAEVDMMKLVASEVDVRGELVILKDDFAKMSGFANPRNAVAGLMGRKDWKAEDIKNVSFIAYTILGDGFTKSSQFKTLKLWGFNTAWSTEIDIVDDAIVDELFELASQEFSYETDGLVLADSEYVNEDKYRPDACKAFKINQLVATTKLYEVDWGMPSKNGVFCPVAILEPVELGGAMIGKATLHNIEFMKKLNADYGDEVEIVRSGDVIPKILSVVSKRTAAAATYATDLVMLHKRWDAPTVCPCCGSALEIDGVNLCCKNKNCEDKKLRQAVDFIKRLGVKSASEATFRKFGIKDIADLVKFQANHKYKSETKLESELLAKVFSRSKQELLAAMNFEDLGETLINRIVDFYGYDNIEAGKQYIGLPNGIGELSLQKFKDKILENLALVNMFINDSRYNHLESTGVSLDATKKNGMSVCFTGKLETMSRSKASELAEANGFEVRGGVNKGLTYLITNNADSGSAKARKAKELGTKVISESEFLKMCNEAEADVMDM